MRAKFIKLLSWAVKNHCIYLWGAQGEKVKNLPNEKIYKMETSRENAERVIYLISLFNAFGWISAKTRAFDCSGLICYCLVKCGLEAGGSSGFDLTADALAERYPRTNKLKPGVLLHRKGHIGCYIGYNHLIEAKGRDYGVVVSPYKPEEWESTFPDPFAALPEE